MKRNKYNTGTKTEVKATPAENRTKGKVVFGLPDIIGYFELPIGAQYILLNNRAVPIRGLAGNIEGERFRPADSVTSHYIYTRNATQKEKRKIYVADREANPPRISRVDQHVPLEKRIERDFG